MLLNPKRQLVTARILVVEDEVIVRLALAEELRRAGLTVYEAATAEEALALIDAGSMIDVVISDVHMPGERSGVDLAQTVLVRWPGLPVVLTSATPLGAAADALRVTFVPKPYELGALVALLATLVPGQADR